MLSSKKLDLFCRVIDHFGDIGVCWRLARQLANEHAMRITLWVDDFASFRKICPAVQIQAQSNAQQIEGITIRRWPDNTASFTPADTADIVIEAFACELPPAYIVAMAARETPPVWINLEYLSAESWVEGCHAMASHHPSLPLVKYFFFPGFSAKTGGLLAEQDLHAKREAFQRDAQASARFFHELGVAIPENATKVSLFCYPSAPVATLFEAMQSRSNPNQYPTVCLAPEGVANEAVSAFLQKPATAGASATRNALTVHVLPFLQQQDYDKLLWACDMNFVRGEDSFVRAQWAARPFVWQIYRQQEDAHITKLQAFIERYQAGLPEDIHSILTDTWQAWNGNPDGLIRWPAFRAALPQLSQHAGVWVEHLMQMGDLASNLIHFIKNMEKIG